MNRGEEILHICWDTLQKKMCLESIHIKRRLKEYKPSEIHCIQYIGDNPNSNVTKLADAFNMTTGGVTKLTKKLIEKNLLDTYKSPNNKKEIYFTLTDKGRKIYSIHQALDIEFQQRDREIFDGITEDTYASMMNFFKQYSEHLDSELEKAGIDTHSGIINRL
ncbi:MAG: MarR family transcriptional regulator [Clostridia bacterium]|nr:MarR family transcriptional regulator [Clostridia bacterium]